MYQVLIRISFILILLISVVQLTAQVSFLVKPKPDSLDCNQADIIGKANLWFLSNGGGTVALNSQFSIVPSKSIGFFISEVRNLRDVVCEKNRNIEVNFTVVDNNGIRGESITTYFKINDDGIITIRNPDLNKRDTCIEDVNLRLITWINNGGNGSVATSCSKQTRWTDFIFNGSDGSSGSGRINAGPYPRIPSNPCGWTLNVTFFAQDSCGNRRGFPGRYILIDNQAPILDQVLRDDTIGCNERIDTFLRVKDVCDRQPAVSYRQLSSSKGTNPDNCNFYNYTLVREWVATDKCGNKSTFNQNLVIKDTQPPSITLQKDLTVSCANLNNIDSLVIGKDDCSKVKINYKDSIVKTSCVDIYYRTYTAEDVCGNIAKASQKLFVHKDQIPVIDQPFTPLSFECVTNQKLAYEQWLANLGGLEVSAKCSDVKFSFGLNNTFLLSDPTTWSTSPPEFANLNTTNSDTVFHIIAFNTCSLAIKIPVILGKSRPKPILTTKNKTVCATDSILVTLENVQIGDSITWFELINNQALIIKNENRPDLKFLPKNGTTKIIAITSFKSCNLTFADTLDLSKTFVKPTADKIKDQLLCEGQALILQSSKQNNKINFWIDPIGNVLRGDSIEVVDKIERVDTGLYKHFSIINNCNSDTTSFQIGVSVAPKVSIISPKIDVCLGSDFVIKVNVSNFDSLIWIKDKVRFANSKVDSIQFKNINNTSAGIYQVIAIKGGCKGDTSQAISVSIKETISLDFTVENTKCEGDSIILRSKNVEFPNIKWVTPNKDTLNGSVVSVKAVNGLYSLNSAAASGCAASGSKQLSFIKRPIIEEFKSNFTACDTSKKDLTFEVRVQNPNPALLYRVQLPNSTIIEKNSFNLKNDASIFGKYSAITYLENCVSDTSFLNIQTDATITNINLEVPTQFCDLDTILIKTVNGFEQYRFNINGQFFTQNNKPEFKFFPSKVDSLVVFVETYNKNCLVGKSNTQLIKTGIKPAKPTIQIGVFDICLADSLRLNVQNPIPDQEYIWYLPTGKTLVTNSLRIIDLPNNLQGSYRVVAKKGTCLSLLSDAIDVKVKPRIPIPSFQNSLPNICEDGTTTVNLCLSNIPKDNSIQFVIEQLPSKKIWSQGRDSCVNKMSSTFEPNTNRLRLYATKDGCTSDEFNDLNINYTVQPNIKASIVPPSYSICNNVDTIRLYNATPIDTLQVTWRVFSSAKLKTLPKNEISLSNLSKGVNKVILTISYLGCRNFSSDTIDLLSGLEPTTLDTTINVLDDLPILLPFDYDSISRYYNVSFKNLEGGEVKVEDGQFFFYPKRFFEGPDTIKYTICFGKCSDQCKEGFIPLVFNKDISCIAPNIITPNGDGINDVFILPCLESDQWGGAQLYIVDQWGNEVFKSSNYQNDFDGTKNGVNLPYDTYYYVIKPNKGVEPLSGFLIIRQE